MKTRWMSETSETSENILFFIHRVFSQTQVMTLDTQRRVRVVHIPKFAFMNSVDFYTQNQRTTLCTLAFLELGRVRRTHPTQSFQRTSTK